MRITWLLEDVSRIWGGTKVALEDANWLHRRGHHVTVLARSGPPDWMAVECPFRQVADFRAENLPDADVVVATFWTTVPWAAGAGPAKGAAVHYCQGYEGDTVENAPLRERIEAAYRLPGVHHVTISGNLTALLRERFGITATQIVYAVDHDVHHPGPERVPGTPLRVGLVGPYQVSWKDLATGYAACELAHAAGQPLVLVRATNTAPDPKELATPFPVEWHRQLPPRRMGDFYRSLDVFLGTSSGPQEGFFLPAVEAMACGVPTVLTDIPCFRSHGDGSGDDRYALFVPPRDPAALAEAVVVAGRLPDVRAALRREGLEVAARYTQDRHGAALEAALRSFVAAGAGGAADTTPSDPDRDAVAHKRELAMLRQRLGDHTGALALCDQLAAGGVDDANLHEVRGAALHALGLYREAADALRAAIAAGAASADTHNRLGVVLFQAGDIRGARRSFERALALEPDSADAQANLSAVTAA